MNKDLYPLTFKPHYTDYPWGGDRIAARYGRTGTPVPCGESWEISAHQDGMSVVDSGSEAGTTLADLCVKWGRDLLGSACETDDKFPLLFKIIDANRNLSVQVHPNEETAEKTGGEPKTEMWYVLDAEKDSGIYAGLRGGTGPRIFHDAVVAKEVESLLSGVAAVPGKCLFIPGGLVHAIGAGCLIYEVQQSSNTTYRIYDWGFIGADGRPRETHIAKAMEVIEWRMPEPELLSPVPEEGSNAANTHRCLLRSDFFRMHKVCLAEPEDFIADGVSFQALFVQDGSVTVTGGCSPDPVLLPRGKSCLIPAAMGRYTLTPQNGPAVVLRTML